VSALAPLVARRLLPVDPRGTVSGAPAPLAIAGAEGLLVTSARCCFPIPDDPIFCVPIKRPRYRDPSRNLCERRGLSQTPREWLPVTWQSAPDRHFSLRDPHRRPPIAPASWPRSPRRLPAPTPISITCRSRHAISIHRTWSSRCQGARSQASWRASCASSRTMPDVLRVTRTIAAHARDYHRRAK